MKSALGSTPPADAQETRDPPAAADFLERRFVISNRLGLHARAAMKLVKTANRFRSEICVGVNGTQVNGKSVMGLLTLAAAQRAALLVTCEGEDAGAAMQAVATLIEAGFGER